jgi:hypothetical protein
MSASFLAGGAGVLVAAALAVFLMRDGRAAGAPDEGGSEAASDEGGSEAAETGLAGVTH